MRAQTETPVSKPAELSDFDLFGRTLPLAPDVARTRRPCIACELLYPRVVDAAHHLCPHCVSDLVATQEVVAAHLLQLDADGDTVTQAWIDYQAKLSDEVADRWTILVQTRQAARTRLERASTGPYSARMTADDIGVVVYDAERALARIATKIAKTRKESGNPLAAILAVEERYLARIADIQRRKRQAEQALEHIAIANGDETPF